MSSIAFAVSQYQNYMLAGMPVVVHLVNDKE